MRYAVTGSGTNPAAATNLSPALSPAKAPASLPATPPALNLPETIIAAPRGETSGGTAPILELTPPELESYGVDTLSDLVDALKPMTRSSRSDQMPVVLINGHLAGQVEFQNIPREAIERVEVLPETVALRALLLRGAGLSGPPHAHQRRRRHGGRNPDAAGRFLAGATRG